MYLPQDMILGMEKWFNMTAVTIWDIPLIGFEIWKFVAHSIGKFTLFFTVYP